MTIELLYRWEAELERGTQEIDDLDDQHAARDSLGMVRAEIKLKGGLA